MPALQSATGSRPRVKHHEIRRQRHSSAMVNSRLDHLTSAVGKLCVLSSSRLRNEHSQPRKNSRPLQMPAACPGYHPAGCLRGQDASLIGFAQGSLPGCFRLGHCFRPRALALVNSVEAGNHAKDQDQKQGRQLGDDEFVALANLVHW